MIICQKNIEEIGERNWYQKAAGNRRLVRKFSSNEFWKFIGLIILAVTYRNKGYKPWGIITLKYLGKVESQIYIYVRGKTD